MKIFCTSIQSIENEDVFPLSEPVISNLKTEVNKGTVLIVKNCFPKKDILKIRNYLMNVGQQSLPNYYPIIAGSPNHHRVNLLDDRSYVKACFHQFSFFPWNQDVFSFFEKFKNIFNLRNLICGLSAEQFLGSAPQDNCTARLSFQFYPKGLGQMNKHQDPFDVHQIAVPILMMSKKGKDFSKGGGFVEKSEGEKIYFDDHADIGDVILFHASIPHGVEVVDPGTFSDWVDFQGRWILIFAINKLSGNSAIPNAVDLEKK